MQLILIVAILVTAAVPMCAQAQPPSTAKATKADAQKVVKMIRGDKDKTQTYCDILNLGEIEHAEQNKDVKKIDELNQKRDELTIKLGREFIVLIDELQDIDPESVDGQEIGSMLEAVDQLCAG
jgi:hypothetical protein